MSDWTFEDKKENCSKRFLAGCYDEYEISTAVQLLSILINDEPRFQFVSDFADALAHACEQVEDSGDINCFIESSHTYLAEAYEKKVGRV